MPMMKTKILLCRTCRAGQPKDAEGIRPGTRLFENLRERDLPEGIELGQTECLSNCKRGCSVMLYGGPRKWTYVYGEVDADADLDIVLEAAEKYHATEDGLIPFSERPQKLKQNTIARVPPSERIENA